MAKRSPVKKKLIKKVKTDCPFCKEKREPDYKKISELEKFTTDRGKIIGQDRSGLCQRHQKRLSKAIKRARFLAFLPFASQV